MATTRIEIPLNDRWNIEALYPSLEAWQSDLNTQLGERQSAPFWPQIASFKGRLGKSPQVCLEALKATLETHRRLIKLYTYAHLRHDEEITHEEYKGAFQRIVGYLHAFNHETAWFDAELLALPEATLQHYLTAPELEPYHFHLEKIARLKSHTLAPEQEELLALSGQALQSSYRAFNALNDADFRFGTIQDSIHQEHDLTHAQFGLYIRSQDRVLRQNAFQTLHSKYRHHQNTLCELLNGAIQSHLFQAKARHYSSCLEAALYPKNIDTSVYHALIQAVHEEIDALHDYLQLRQEVMKLQQLQPWDLHVPLIQEVDLKFTYQEAEEHVIHSLKPLGREYQELLRRGLCEGRWVDRYENLHKRSGAYSSGCYDSMPYILMNYKNTLRDAFILTHEAGHSMHSLYSRHHQPYHYSDYSIFLAEVASTFHEELLNRYLLERSKSREERIFLLNQKIEDIRGTLFRQALFAEFELAVHQMAEKNQPITPQTLNELYRSLHAFYFGAHVAIDSDLTAEWARIPHFYYNFYVFQYATGISAALALAERVISGGSQEREEYLEFLKGGSSRYPLELLQFAGVNMRSPQPVKAAIAIFRRLVQELRSLLLV